MTSSIIGGKYGLKLAISLEEEGNIKEKSTSMKSLNPVYTWREWMVVPAYEEAEKEITKK